jgi:hypothetical protein
MDLDRSSRARRCLTEALKARGSQANVNCRRRKAQHRVSMQREPTSMSRLKTATPDLHSDDLIESRATEDVADRT